MLIFSVASVVHELLGFFSLNKSCKTHLGPMQPPGGRNWHWLVWFYLWLLWKFDNEFFASKIWSARLVSRSCSRTEFCCQKSPILSTGSSLSSSSPSTRSAIFMTEKLIYWRSPNFAYLACHCVSSLHKQTKDPRFLFSFNKVGSSYVLMAWPNDQILKFW